LIEKTQLKREAYKVLGRPHSDLTVDRVFNIYNDYDFYQALLKDFLANNDATYVPTEGGAGGADDDIYLDGADIGLTQKFLAKRQKLKEAQASKKKEVDRKASKHRKIRYVVHEKIVNFMTPLENLMAQEGKENIVMNLFGQ
jgi:protein AATF/BFR2